MRTAISPAHREPNGRHVRADAPKGYAPAEIKRMFDNLAANSRLPWLGTAYGRMMAEAAITPAQFEACRRWDELRASYLAALDASELRSQMHMVDASGGEPPDPDSEVGVKISERDQRTIASYRQAKTAIYTCGRVEATDFRGICEGAEYATYTEKRNVRRCADVLVKLWKISDIEQPRRR